MSFHVQLEMITKKTITAVSQIVNATCSKISMVPTQRIKAKRRNRELRGGGRCIFMQQVTCQRPYALLEPGTHSHQEV